MFADTNILIDLFRGKASSIEMLEKFRGGIKISIIVLMELIDGLKSKSDIAKLRKQLINTIGIEIIQINDEISETSYELFSTFRHSHGISINDANQLSFHERILLFFISLVFIILKFSVIRFIG